MHGSLPGRATQGGCSWHQVMVFREQNKGWLLALLPGSAFLPQQGFGTPSVVAGLVSVW